MSEELSGPIDVDGREFGPERILDEYLNTGDYDDALDGWVSWDGTNLKISQVDENNNEVTWTWNPEV